MAGKPPLYWLPEAKKTWRSDVIAGLTVWTLVIPEAVAYTSLATVPPQAGIFTVVVGIFVYAIVGNSRLLVASATAATAAMMGAIVADVSLSPKEAAGAITLAVGVVFLAAGFLRLGFVLNFISAPVNKGFLVGLAIFISIGQAFKLFGLDSADGDAFVKLWELVSHLGNINWTSTAVGVVALAGLFGLPKIAPKIPAGLFVVALATIASTVFDLAKNEGIKVVGKIPSGLPTPSIPSASFSDWATIFAAAGGVVLLGLSEAIPVASQLDSSDGEKLDDNAEIRAFGFVNVANGLFGGMVGAGSMSSSSLNQESGAKTPLSSAVAGVAGLLTLLFFTPLFTNLPEAVLGALIIHALSHHLRFRTVYRIRRYDYPDFWLGALATLGVLLFDVLGGLLLAMFINLFYFIYRATRVRLSELGSLPDAPEILVATSMYPDAKLPDHVLGIRIDGEFYYANAQPTVDEITSTIKKHKDATDLLLDMTAVFDLDYTCAHELKRIETQCEKSNVELHLVRVHSAIEDDLKKVGLDSFVISRDDAIPERLVGKRAKPADSGADEGDKRSAPSRTGKSGHDGS